MYRPNFCAECGARIERERWRLWTSSRFCATCERRFRKVRFLMPLAACAVLLLSGFAAGRFIRPAPPPLIINRAPSISPSTPVKSASPMSATSTQEKNAASKPDATRYGSDGTADERPTDPDEIVSICGARTKKGTPCSRRVRGTGRCWQHKGRPAMLPPGKLIVQG